MELKSIVRNFLDGHRSSSYEELEIIGSSLSGEFGVRSVDDLKSTADMVDRALAETRTIGDTARSISSWFTHEFIMNGVFLAAWVKVFGDVEKAEEISQWKSNEIVHTVST
eukprot:TRINITY_DN6945_c0_g2_i1.p1 TRINITY_DN6945_c0_g2~~TRINITY_DN6945_c0_g2_i1.p1  ORF type:complete len:111 (+),score=30.06 TRINITY_DN6945_c0_g2_i1:926-1258(+)